MASDSYPPLLRRLILGATALSLLAGCGSGSDYVAACRARQSTQLEGVHGCITASNDVGNPSVEPLSDFPVEIFESAPPPTPGDGSTPFAQARSDAVGFYEIGLPAGTHQICTSFRRCAELTVPSASNVALDYDFGVGPGWSQR